MDLLEKKDPQN